MILAGESADPPDGSDFPADANIIAMTMKNIIIMRMMAVIMVMSVTIMMLGDCMMMMVMKMTTLFSFFSDNHLKNSLTPILFLVDINIAIIALIIIYIISK